MSAVERFHPAEAKNRPHVKRMRVQGANKIVGRILPNTEYKTESGLYMPDLNKTQDRPHCCEVIQLSPEFDAKKYPDVKIGSLLMYKPLAGDEFEQLNEWYVILNCDYIRGVYDWPESEDTIEADRNQQREGFEKFHAEQAAALEAAAEKPSVSIPSLIRVN